MTVELAAVEMTPERAEKVKQLCQYFEVEDLDELIDILLEAGVDKQKSMGRWDEVLEIIRAAKEPLTAKQIAAKSGGRFNDGHEVRGYLHLLLEKGYVQYGPAPKKAGPTATYVSTNKRGRANPPENVRRRQEKA